MAIVKKGKRLKSDAKINAYNIINGLYSYFINNDYRLNNVYMFEWETDFYCQTKSGYNIEVEIKISKSDYRADFKKDKHILFEKNIINKDSEHMKIPNKFYYCMPDGMISPNDVPLYAGLLYYKNGHIYTEKPAPLLHKFKRRFDRKIKDKSYWNYLEYRQLVITQQRTIQGFNEKKEIAYYKDQYDYYYKESKRLYIENQKLENDLFELKEKLKLPV